MVQDSLKVSNKGLNVVMTRSETIF